MKRLKFPLVAILLLSLFLFAACTEELSESLEARPEIVEELPESLGEAPENIEELPENIDVPPSSGKIYLYGEAHRVEKILIKEFELWSNYYNNYDMRHLFMELPYFTAEFLNIWMQEDDDNALQFVFDDWDDTLSYVSPTLDFLYKIKRECPETIFHGTDVGHQYNSTGKQYLSYLEENGMEDSEEYALTTEAIAQGKRFYGEDTSDDSDYLYREDKMAENFIREFDKLNGKSIMGIYGSAHTPLDGKAYTSIKHPCMANQLYARYGEQIYSEDISWMARDNEPIGTETMVIEGKEYEAILFADRDISAEKMTYVRIKFWRLENAYDDFANNLTTGFVQSADYFFMEINPQQILLIEYIKEDGSVLRWYYRTDETQADGQIKAMNIIVGQESSPLMTFFEDAS